MNHLTDETAAIAAQLQPKAVLALRDLQRRFCLFGWESYTATESDLVALRLLRGGWYGSLSAPAQPMWTLTTLGERVLAYLDASSVSPSLASISGEKP